MDKAKQYDVTNGNGYHPLMQQNQQQQPRSDRALTLHEVKDRTGLGKTKIYAMIKEGDFPAPGKFGKASRWSEIAVDRAIGRVLNRH